MDKLEEYLGKSVRITDIDGQVWSGKVDLFDSRDDNESGYDSISLMCDDHPEVLVEINENEIKDIELV